MSEDLEYEIVLNEYGYREAVPKPDPETLREFYADKYFQSDTRYSHSYSDEETRYVQAMIERKRLLLDEAGELDGRAPRLLEVGVGEGWTLANFAANGSEVVGIDYSDYACRHHNPQVADALIQGPPEDRLRELTEAGERFDVVWLDNVLEHASDPAQLLRTVHGLVATDGHLVVEVPNDFSALQMECRDRGVLERNSWEFYPEHLSYFNRDGLERLAVACGWQLRRAIGDFPIDMFLLNEASNYYRDNTLGKQAHQARVAFELMVSRQPAEKALDLYEAMLEVGLGRQIVAVFARTS